MKSNPLVSVIIPTHNSVQFLDACLTSIKNQSYKNIEIIVIDNNSIDKTKEIAKKYTENVFNKGPERSAQRNYGVNKSKGDYLLIHDSDVYFHQDTIKECVKLALINDFDALILPEKSIGVGYWAKVKAFERSFYVGNVYIEGVRFFKKSIYIKIGGYDENLCGPEDWDLTIRIRNNGYKIGRTKLLVTHNEGVVKIIGSSIKKKYYANDVFQKYALKHPLEFKKQMNFFVRFPLTKLVPNMFKHPILTISMLLMKSIEFLVTIF